VHLHVQVARYGEQESAFGFGIQVKEQQRVGLVRRLALAVGAKDENGDGRGETAEGWTR